MPEKRLWSFNSTLVQLKVNTDGILNAASKSFNSTLVQLKVTLSAHSVAIKNCFNSTLVQLKAHFQL